MGSDSKSGSKISLSQVHGNNVQTRGPDHSSQMDAAPQGPDRSVRQGGIDQAGSNRSCPTASDMLFY
jgi:hypothetical protein